jgi:hypothetical protein
VQVANHWSRLPGVLGLIIGLVLFPGLLVLSLFLLDRHPLVLQVLLVLWLAYAAILAFLIFARPWIEWFYHRLDREQAKEKAKLWVEKWTRDHAHLPMEEIKEKASHDIDEWMREQAHLYKK